MDMVGHGISCRVADARKTRITAALTDIALEDMKCLEDMSAPML